MKDVLGSVCVCVCSREEIPRAVGFGGYRPDDHQGTVLQVGGGKLRGEVPHCSKRLTRLSQGLRFTKLKGTGGLGLRTHHSPGKDERKRQRQRERECKKERH